MVVKDGCRPIADLHKRVVALSKHAYPDMVSALQLCKVEAAHLYREEVLCSSTNHVLYNITGVNFLLCAHEEKACRSPFKLAKLSMRNIIFKESCFYSNLSCLRLGH